MDVQDATPEQLEFLDTHFNFHPVSVATCKKGQSEPPILQLFPDHAYLLIHRVFYRFEDETTHYRPVSAYFSSRRLLTVHGSNLSRLFAAIRTRIEGAPDQLFQFGVGTSLLAIIEGLIADYQPILETWQEELDQLEESVLHHRSAHAKNRKPLGPEQNKQEEMIPQILKFKKLAGNLRKSLHPQRQVLIQLNEHAREPWLNEHERPWVKHVLEDWNALLREIDHLRTHVGGVFEVYATALTLDMTRSAHQQNQVMQRLNVITAIFLPLTFIVGVYGMNIPDIPEIKVPGFYNLLWGIMIGLALGLLSVFKWMRWI
jgi:magnesium transporter